MEMWHRVGLTEARWVDAAEAASMVPVLNVEDVLGCTFCPTDGIASPADVTIGYAAAARRHGARLKEGVEVTGIDVASVACRACAPRPAISRRAWSINCAGAWAASIGRMAGLEIPVLPYRRHIAVTGTFPGGAAHHADDRRLPYIALLPPGRRRRADRHERPQPSRPAL